MAGTPRFPDWYLYCPELEGEPRQTFIAQMAEFDPQGRVAQLAPAPLLFQFGDDDFHVPVERVQAFYDAAAEPKELRWYKAPHELNEQAAADREAWLGDNLGLKSV